MTMNFDHTTLGQRAIFGTGLAEKNMVKVIEEIGARRVLLIASGFAGLLVDAVVANTPVVARIQDVVQHVPVLRGRAAVAVAREQGADLVVAIGGGSAIGLAKVVARDTGLSIVAVPSTFAGSEATNVWGHTYGEHKTTGVDDRVLPKIVIYDAALSKSLPGRLATASGLNAVAHAVDGMWAPRADPINTALGAEGLRALIPGLRALNSNPDDLEAREQILYGAYLAAVAFASAGSGIHHKICHVLGGAYRLSHAEMHAILLPYVTSFNASAAPGANARLREILDCKNVATGLYELRKELGVADSLADLGLKEEDIPDAARLAFEAIPASNPRPFTYADIMGIIHGAWSGATLKEDSR